MGEVVDPELADIAASWASQIDDEAAVLRRRAEHGRDLRRRADLVRLTDALGAVARTLRSIAAAGRDGASEMEPALEPVREERARAVALAWSFRLRNAAEDAQALALELEHAAEVLDSITHGDGGHAVKVLLDRSAMA